MTNMWVGVAEWLAFCHLARGAPTAVRKLLGKCKMAHFKTLIVFSKIRFDTFWGGVVISA